MQTLSVYIKESERVIYVPVDTSSCQTEMCRTPIMHILGTCWMGLSEITCLLKPPKTYFKPKACMYNPELVTIRKAESTIAGNVAQNMIRIRSILVFATVSPCLAFWWCQSQPVTLLSHDEGRYAGMNVSASIRQLPWSPLQLFYQTANEPFLWIETSWYAIVSQPPRSFSSTSHLIRFRWENFLSKSASDLYPLP
jgi:hypothetical protein